MAAVGPRLIFLAPLAAIAVGCGSSPKHAAPPPPAAPQPPSASATNVPLGATFRALEHRPRVDAPWRFVVGATPNDSTGAALRSEVHVRVRVRGVWVEFGTAGFTGVYQDMIKWPPAARGKLLIFEATVARGDQQKRFRFWLRPR
jgi:hypothetical protein